MSMTKTPLTDRRRMSNTTTELSVGHSDTAGLQGQGWEDTRANRQESQGPKTCELPGKETAGWRRSHVTRSRNPQRTAVLSAYLAPDSKPHNASTHGPGTETHGSTVRIRDFNTLGISKQTSKQTTHNVAEEWKSHLAGLTPLSDPRTAGCV